MNIYPSYQRFYEWYLNWRKLNKNHSPLPHKWIIIGYYISVLILITIAFIGIKMLSGGSSYSSRSKYPSHKYKKVVKEGILWDSVEYHER